jgi:hypothetical protein
VVGSSVVLVGSFVFAVGNSVVGMVGKFVVGIAGMLVAAVADRIVAGDLRSLCVPERMAGVVSLHPR